MHGVPGSECPHAWQHKKHIPASCESVGCLGDDPTAWTHPAEESPRDPEFCVCGMPMESTLHDIGGDDR